MNSFNLWANVSESYGGCKERVSSEMGLQTCHLTFHTILLATQLSISQLATLHYQNNGHPQGRSQRSVCGGGDTEWFDFSFICRCLPGKVGGGGGAPLREKSWFFNYREAAGASARRKDTRQEIGAPVCPPALTSLEILREQFSGPRFSHL